MADPTPRADPTTPAPDPHALAPQMLRHWVSLRDRLTLAAQHGEPIDPADLLDELRLSEATARALTDDRWPRIATLLLTRGAADLWTSIADALSLRPEEAHALFLAWIAHQQRQYRATGRGLAPAEVDRLHTALAEVAR